MSDTFCDGCPNCKSDYVKHMEDEQGNPILDEKGKELCRCDDCDYEFPCEEMHCTIVEYGLDTDEKGWK